MKRTRTTTLTRPQTPVRYGSPFSSHLPPPRRSSSGMRNILMVLLLMVIVGGVIGYFAYHSNRATSAMLTGATTASRRFVSALASGDYKSASGLLSAQAKVDNTPESLQQEIALLQKHNGAWMGADLAGAEPRNIAGLQTCKITYDLRCERGSAKLILVMVRGYRGWTVDSVTFG